MKWILYDPVTPADEPAFIMDENTFRPVNDEEKAALLKLQEKTKKENEKK